MMMSRALVTVLTLLAAASTLTAIGEGFGLQGITALAAWVFIAAAFCGWYTATGLMLAESFDRDTLPLGVFRTETVGRATGQREIRHPAPTPHRVG